LDPAAPLAPPLDPLDPPEPLLDPPEPLLDPPVPAPDIPPAELPPAPPDPEPPPLPPLPPPPSAGGTPVKPVAPSLVSERIEMPFTKFTFAGECVEYPLGDAQFPVAQPLGTALASNSWRHATVKPLLAYVEYCTQLRY
jgi:hypothetical protein